jgi:hypothetical protein
MTFPNGASSRGGRTTAYGKLYRLGEKQADGEERIETDACGGRDQRLQGGRLSRRDYLREAATGHMGLPSSERLAENCATTAAILIGMRPEFEAQ